MASDTGNIDVTVTGLLDAQNTDSGSMTHGVRALSNSGDIAISTADVWADGFPLNGQTAVEAQTGGAGDIAISTGTLYSRGTGLVEAG